MNFSTPYWLLSMLLLLGSSALAQTTYYVDCSAPAGGNGSSWALAFDDLQDALGLAGSGDQIVVAQGAYSPSTSNVSIPFELNDGVQLLGGYLNTDVGLSQRDPELNVTILTGSLGADCNGNGGSGNSYTVLYTNDVSAATLIDGFTITGGNAGAACSAGILERQGGAWYNDGSGPGNNSSPTIRNCKFIGNQANCGGGAFFNDGNFSGTANPSFEQCTFEGNYCNAAGGAIYNNGNAGIANPTFTNCKFISNGTMLAPVSYGGAMYNFGKNGNANPTFINCLFSENSAYAGAGIYNLGQSGNANPQIINCTFYGNAAQANGGAIYANAGSSPNIGNADPYIVNTIFYGNTAAPFLGPIFRNNNGDITVKNCLFDVAADCSELNSGVGPNVVCNGLNWFSADPDFTNPAAEDFSLSATSPAINVGENTDIGGISLDLEGNNRIQQSFVDLGAIESPYATPSPVELLAFEAEAMEGSVYLYWTTLTELNNEAFWVERSRDGFNFESIARIDGSGTSPIARVYELFDEHPYSGINYYRLQQRDFDGKISYGPIRAVSFSALVVELFPNPVAGALHLSVSSYARGQAQFSISNVYGKVVYEGEMEVGPEKYTHHLPEAADWDAGTYFVRVFEGGKNSSVLRFVVARE